MTLTPQSVFDEYEARLTASREEAGSLAADLLEERAQRREVAEALVRVTEERDRNAGQVMGLRIAVDTLDAQRREALAERDELAKTLEFEREHHKGVREYAVQRQAERDEARAEVEQWKQAFGEDGLRVAKARLLDALGRSRRPWTDDEHITREDGTVSTRVHVKRACNGCGELLGDVTDEEMDRAVAGLPADDVRSECLTCTPLPSPAVSIDALSREVVRLRTIIGELGAAEAGEPLDGAM